MYNGGIYVYRKGEKVKHLTTKNSAFLTSDCVSALYEDYEGNCWIGTRGGIGVRLSDGTDYRFETMNFNDSLSAGWIYVRDIVQDMDNSVWLATSNFGVIHITGDVRQPSTLKYENYSFHNRKLITNTVLCMHIDRFGRLWAGTEGGGLYLYNRSTGQFEEKTRTYSIPGDVIVSIEEDKSGNLWLGTVSGLVKLYVVAVGNDFRLVYILLLMDYKITLLSIRLVAVMENSSLEAIKATIVFFPIKWKSHLRKLIS